VEVGDREQLGGAGLQPLDRRPRLALGAMAVAAGVVCDPRVGAILASLDVAAERGGAAGFDGGHDAELSGTDVPGIGFAPRFAVAAEDIRHLQVGPRHCRRVRPAATLRTSDAQVGSGSAGSC
jgi:hypothetical protein